MDAPQIPVDFARSRSQAQLARDASWHLVFTKPAGEDLAATNLQRQGYGVYLPRLKRRILRRGAWRETISALFPRYLFVRLRVGEQSLGPVRSTVGVANLVRFGADVISVPPAVVSGLIEREDRCGLHILSERPLFEHGFPVRIIQGPLAGIDGIFDKDDAGDRVVILLNLLGRQARIKLPSTSVVPQDLVYG